MKTIYTAESLTDNKTYYFTTKSKLNDFLQGTNDFYITGSRKICNAMYKDFSNL